MLTLTEKKGPQRVVLRPANGKEPEAAVLLAPIDASMRRRAQHAVKRMLGPDADLELINADLLFDISETASKELVRLGIIGWEGIGDANDVPLPVTPDRETRMATANDPDRPTGTVDLLLADEDLFGRLDAEYVRPDAVRRAEKNGLSGSPHGTSTRATPGKSTARRPAAPKAKKAAAKSARTVKTSSKPTPRKRSGKS